MKNFMGERKEKNYEKINLFGTFVIVALHDIGVHRMWQEG